jgi:uncharacterized tellurite resistance protein B-like protein
MLNRLKRLIDSLGEEKDQRLDFADHKLAAAALLVHATMIDGSTDMAEQNKLRQLLASHYGLGADEVLELIRLAEREEKEAVDLYGFTRRISQHLAPEQRLEIIEMLWEIAFSDGVLHEFEDNLVWRVAELLHVPARDRIALKQKVQARNRAANDK